MNPMCAKRNLSFLVPEDQVAVELAKIVEFMRGDSDRHVFRRFERLNLYNLLYLQRRLADYDDQLAVAEQTPDGSCIASLLPQLQPLLKEYNEALLLQTQIAKVKPAAPHLVSWLVKYANENLRSLCHELNPGMGWYELLCMTDQEKGRIYKFVEKRNYLSKLFSTQKSSAGTAGLYTYSDRAVSIAERTVINALFCLLIIAPIFVLSILTSKWSKICVVLACVLLVSPIVSVLASRTQNTGLGVMAGYTAILVVFLTNGTGV